MNTYVTVVSPLTTVYEAVQRMTACNCQVAIVDRADEDDAYGMVTFQEIAYKVIPRALEPSRVRVADIMVKPLIVVNPNLRLPFIAQLFANTNIQNAPVIEEHKLVGIISTADLVRALLAEDSE
jgi:CBS domain-containing protein